VGLAPLDVHDEADAARVVLVGRVVEALPRRKAKGAQRSAIQLVTHEILLVPM
jgi:hypothetical protein